MRFRLALIATLVAAFAVAAGAQAASGDQSGAPNSLPSGKAVQVKTKPMSVPPGAHRISVTGTRTHNSGGAGHDNIANALNLSSSVNGSVCRFPSYCFLSDDNIGATTESGETTNCPPAFDSTVWYVVTLNHAGLLDVVVNNTEPGGFQAMFEIYNASTGNGFCGAASSTTTNFGDTYVAGPGTALGRTVVMAVGATLSGTAGGSYNLNLRWNPDTDGDGILDSSDNCDFTPGGPHGIGGCPDTDADHIIDLNDACKTRPGPAKYSGCPDTDGDGKPDRTDSGFVSDVCPFKSIIGKTDKNNNGCPDLERINAKFSGIKFGSYFKVRHGRNVLLGLRIRKLVISGIPRGARVTVTCSRHACKKKSKRAGKSRKVKFGKGIKGRKLKAGVKLIIRITLKGFVGDARVFNIKRNDYTTADRCLNPGSSKLRKHCSTTPPGF